VPIAGGGEQRHNVIMYDNARDQSIGGRIRSLRKARGLSLHALATRCGTSAPTLHRYETGWDRFEVATLRRIAAALDARLDIRLEARAQTPVSPGARRLRKLLAPLFWDRKLSATDLREHPRWVLGRVLMYGDMTQVSAARSYYGDAAITAAVAQRGVDERTRNYWTLLLGPSDAPKGTEQTGLEARP